jgi:beta-lactamase regulating signal transducer with metallopeptidase domain
MMENSIVLLAAKVTVVTALALVAASLARGSRASLRHGIFAALFIALLLLPLAASLVPKTELPVLKESGRLARSDRPSRPIEDGRQAGRLTTAAGTAALQTPRSIALSIYAFGAAAMVFSLLAGIVRLRRWSKRAEVWLDGMRVASEVAAASGIRRAVLVVTCDEVAVPFTFGFWRQTIVMPAAAKSWGEDAVRRALRHELEHVRRDDWALQLVARVACAVYWPHPFVWVRRCGP